MANEIIYDITWYDNEGDVLQADGLTKEEFDQIVKEIREAEGERIKETWKYVNGEFAGRPI